jgi:hypothetical protein
MGRPLKIAKLLTATGVGRDISNPVISSLTNPVTPAGVDTDEFYGVVGGQIQSDGTAASGPSKKNPVLKVRVRIAGESEDDGYILRQKGNRKYLVQDTSGNVGICVLADQADSALSEGNMTISIDTDGSSLIRLTKLTNKFGVDFSGNHWFLNFFSGVDGETAVKSGAANNGTINLAKVEGWPQP